MKFTFKHIYVFVLLFISEIVFAQKPVVVERQVTLMGSVFNITLVDKDSVSANKNIDLTIAEISRIENLISEWQPHTQISQVNQNAGVQPVKVDKEVFDLTKRAIDYSKMSNGAFDISTVSMDKIWRFDGSMTEMPSSESIKKSIANVDYRNIILDSINSTIFLKNKGMKIGFGSIGKGYAADKGRELMQNKGIKAGIVNASGDIATWGTQINGKPWAIGIRNPFKRQKVAKILKLKNSAVATSGSYEKYAEIDGVRYSHIINPKTGFPATGLTSVTIYGPSSEFCNALSTSIMVLGEKEGLKLVRKFPKYRYLLITDEGKIRK
jgi:thiamine biosynthesis lipoprotein